MHIEWDENKNFLLKKKRNISFEVIVGIILSGEYVDIIPHPNDKYAHQYIYICEYKNQIYCVPFVIEKEIIFLKTIIPGTKLIKKYEQNKTTQRRKRNS